MKPKRNDTVVVKGKHAHRIAAEVMRRMPKPVCRPETFNRSKPMHSVRPGGYHKRTVEPIPVMNFADFESDISFTVALLRLCSQLSQRQLSLRMGVPRTYVSKVENGHAVPTIANLLRFCSALECSPAAFITIMQAVSKDKTDSALKPNSLKESMNVLELRECLIQGCDAPIAKHNRSGYCKEHRCMAQPVKKGAEIQKGREASGEESHPRPVVIRDAPVLGMSRSYSHIYS